jgi:hypothetical protein
MDDQFMVAAYLSTDESLADLRCGVLDTGCNNTCYTEVDWNRTIDELRGLKPIDYVTLSSDPDLASLSIELSPSPIVAVKDYPPSHADAVKGLHGTEMSMSRFLDELLTSVDELDFRS